MLKSSSLFIINESDQPFLGGAIGMLQFTTVVQGERYLDAAGNVAAGFIHEFYGWQFQLRLPAFVSKGDRTP